MISMSHLLLHLARDSIKHPYHQHFLLCESIVIKDTGKHTWNLDLLQSLLDNWNLKVLRFPQRFETTSNVTCVASQHQIYLLNFTSPTCWCITKYLNLCLILEDIYMSSSISLDLGKFVAVARFWNFTQLCSHFYLIWFLTRNLDCMLVFTHH